MKPQRKAPWRLRLYQKDALEFVKSDLKDKVDLFCIDPPFGSNPKQFMAGQLRIGKSKKEDPKGRDNFYRDMSPFILISPQSFIPYMVELLKAIYDKMTDTGVVAMFLNDASLFNLWPQIPSTYHWRITIHHYYPSRGAQFRLNTGRKVYNCMYPIAVFSKKKNLYENAVAAKPFLTPLIPKHLIGKKEESATSILTNLWYTPTERKYAYFTAKPVPLMKALVSCYCPPKGIVCDCFCGSGSTGEAALTTGRRAILSDIGDEAITATKLRLMPYLQKHGGKK